MSSAKALKLDWPKILLFGKELREFCNLIGYLFLGTNGYF